MDSTASPSPTKAHKPAGARACLCSPTTHPGSFRCKLHRGAAGRILKINPGPPSAAPPRSAAKVTSMRTLLMQIIRPASHDAGRRRDFQPKPSRFLLMNGSGHGVPVN